MGKTVYLVVEVKDCPKCGGSGWVSHPAWREYHAEWEKAKAQGLDLDYRDWFKGQGYHFEEDIPPEEVACVTCNGVGRVRMEISLEEALQALGLLKREMEGEEEGAYVP